MPDFGILDVLIDALRSWWRRFGTHLGFNAIFVCVLFLSFCLIGCVLGVFMSGTIAAIGSAANGNDPFAAMGAMGGMFALIYGAMLVFMLIAAAAHQAFSLQVAGEDLRGGQPTLSGAFRQVGERLLPHVGAMLVKGFLYSLVLCITGGVFGALAASRITAMSSGNPGTAILQIFQEFALVIMGMYAVQILWVCTIRTFLGLTGPVIQIERRGVFDAMRRSAALLSGRRLHFLGLCIVWGIAFFVAIFAAYVPMLVLVFAMQGDGGQPNPFAGLIMLPYMLFFYAFMLMLYSLDSVIEAAYHARLVPVDARGDQVAQVFR